MKIYTYYQNINHPANHNQARLIDLWKLSWSRHGYEPIVLSLADAKKHPNFEAFNTNIRRIHKEITGKPINEYGMSCWLRWLAYAMQAEEKFYVSDYDAINFNLQITEPIDQLHLMNNVCPFLASGTPRQFNNLCKAFIDVSSERLASLNKWTNHYHDQEFFQYNLLPKYNSEYQKCINKYEILITRSKEIGGFYDPILNKYFNVSKSIEYCNMKNCAVLHIAHYNVKLIRDKYPELDNNYPNQKLRIKMIEDILNI